MRRTKGDDGNRAAPRARSASSQSPRSSRFQASMAKQPARAPAQALRVRVRARAKATEARQSQVRRPRQEGSWMARPVKKVRTSMEPVPSTMYPPEPPRARQYSLAFHRAFTSDQPLPCARAMAGCDRAHTEAPRAHRAEKTSRAVRARFRSGRAARASPAYQAATHRTQRFQVVTEWAGSSARKEAARLQARKA